MYNINALEMYFMEGVGIDRRARLRPEAHFFPAFASKNATFNK